MTAETRPSLEIASPTLPLDTIDRLPAFISETEKQVNENRAKQIFGILVHSLHGPLPAPYVLPDGKSMPEPIDGATLLSEIREKILIPNAQRRESLRARGLSLRNPVTNFEVSSPLDITFYGKQPSSAVVWWMIQYGLDPRQALDMQTYRFENGADVRVANLGGGAKGVTILGTKQEKYKILTCTLTTDPLTHIYDDTQGKNVPIQTLRLNTPKGFSAESSATRGQAVRRAGAFRGPNMG